MNDILLNDIVMNNIVMNDIMLYEIMLSVIMLTVIMLNVAVPNLRQNHIFLFQFGRFTCKCLPGYGDRFSDDEDRSGRYCESWCQRHKTFFRRWRRLAEIS
jgi:hypothetical protein